MMLEPLLMPLRPPPLTLTWESFPSQLFSALYPPQGPAHEGQRVYGRKVRHQQLCLPAVWPLVGHCPSLNLAEEQLSSVGHCAKHLYYLISF